MNLDRYDRGILAYLCEDGGYTTAMIARSSSIRRSAQWTRQCLLTLEKAGYVKRVDDLKPVGWMRTQAGMLALNGVRPP